MSKTPKNFSTLFQSSIFLFGFKSSQHPLASAIDTLGYRGTKGKTYSNVFYGRGLIQLTHEDAYKYISTKIGLRKDELYVNPDKALEPKISYDIMTYWMQNNIPNTKGAGRT